MDDNLLIAKPTGTAAPRPPPAPMSREHILIQEVVARAPAGIWAFTAFEPAPVAGLAAVLERLSATGTTSHDLNFLFEFSIAKSMLVFICREAKSLRMRWVANPPMEALGKTSPLAAVGGWWPRNHGQWALTVLACPLAMITVALGVTFCTPPMPSHCPTALALEPCPFLCISWSS
jgi:hypothetical protein